MFPAEKRQCWGPRPQVRTQAHGHPGATLTRVLPVLQGDLESGRGSPSFYSTLTLFP